MFPLIPPNQIVTEGREWHVSYNSLDVASYGDVTTALVTDDHTHFYILNGDHREGYKDLTLDECKQYFLAHIDQINEKHSEKME